MHHTTEKKKKPRHQNKGLRKVCDCGRRKWAKCPHSWYLNFKPRSGASYRLSLDKHFRRHIDSKTEAEELAVELRKQMRAGTFGQVTPRAEMTLRQLADVYLERYVQVEHADTVDGFRSLMNVICRTEVSCPTGGALAFGLWRVHDIVSDSVERFREARRQTAGAGGTNRTLSRLRALFNWAVRVGYLDRTPFKRNGETVVKLSGETARSRRLQEGEEAAILAHCNPHTRAVITAALETGMRKGEIMSLRWKQVEGMRVEGTTLTWAPRAELVLHAADTKTRRSRRIPISTRLRATLEMRRFDPAGRAMPIDSFVFGNAIGQRQKDVKRAWQAAVLKAHGVEPKYTRPNVNLTAECQAAFEKIDLHFHDLRREAGSRWMDAGVPLATIQRWLGHTNISQTSTYLAGTSTSEHEHMRRFEERRGVCNEFARDAETGHHDRPQMAAQQDETLNKTAGDRELTIM